MDILIGLEVLLGSWGRGEGEERKRRRKGGRGEGIRDNTILALPLLHDLTHIPWS